jgi:hypothetical protein
MLAGAGHGHQHLSDRLSAVWLQPLSADQLDTETVAA